MNLGAPSWLIAWLEGVSVWDVILIGAFIVALVFFIKNKGWRTAKAMAKGILYAAEILEAVQDSPDFQKRIEAKVNEIHHETHTNDGSSIKDAVGRVEKTAERLEEGVAGLHGRLDPVEADLALVKEAVAQLQSADEEIRAELEQTQPKEKP